MKKLLFLCLAIVAIQFAKAAEPADVTDQYLGNITQPLDRTGETIIGDNERWQRVASPWIYQNEHKEEKEVDGELVTVYTTWHADANKNNRLTLTPGWDGFSANFENVKIYQPTTLGPGQYELTIAGDAGGDWYGTEEAYVVVSLGGEGIEDIEELGNALAFGQLNEASDKTQNLMSIFFTLEDDTEVSVGFVSTGDGTNGCYSIVGITLYVIEGVSYKALQRALDSAKAMAETQYPTGTIPGTYSKEKWDALQVAIAEAEAFIEDDLAEEQSDVDVVIEAIRSAINDLNASLVLPFRLSDDSNEYWYQIRDNRATKNYWAFGDLQFYNEETEELTEYPVALVITQEPDAEDNTQLFKIVRAEEPFQGYYIYNREIEGLPLHLPVGEGVVVFDEEGEGTTWLFNRGVDGSHYIIFTEGGNRQLNSHLSDPNRVGPYNSAADAGNNWEFIQLVEEGDVDFSELLPLISTALAMGSTNYPIGVKAGEYPQENWDIFANVRSQAVAIAERAYTDDEPSQSEVDDITLLLQEAIDQLKASVIPPVLASTDSEEYWYVIHDRRAAHNHWKLGDFDKEDSESSTDETYQQVLLKGDNGVISTNMLFKFVKPEDSALTGYVIYNKLMPEFPLVANYDTDDEWVGIDEFEETAATWIFTPTKKEDYYLIAIENEPGVAANQINSYMRATPFIGFYNGGASDDGNNWRFELATETSVKEVKASDLNIHVLNRTIVSSNPTDTLEVYNINGQRLNAKQQLSQGVYIVRIVGKEGVAKVIVR